MLTIILFLLTALTSHGFALTNSRRGTTGMLQMSFVSHCEEIKIDTDHVFSVHDITTDVENIVNKVGCKEGVATVFSKHTTVSVTMNEMEGRLVDDIRQYFLKLAPPYYPYLHNDIDYRVGPDDWPGGDPAWREFRRTQPVNAHSHLIAMMLGTSESIPVSKGALQRGKYQNVMIADMDGPKTRTIVVQVMGST